MNRRFRATLPGLAMLCALAVVACQSVAQREWYYQLAPSIQAQRADAKPSGTVLVNRLDSHGFASGRQIVFRERAGSLELQRYHYHFWTQAPAEMIREALTRALRATGQFRYVIGPAERVMADWIVSGTILRLEHVPNATPANVVLEVELSIVSNRTNEAVFLKNYLESETAATHSIDDAIQAFNRALERMLAQFQTDVRQDLR